MIGIWFFLNLFLGVIFLSFSTEEKKILRKDLNEHQSKWIETTKMIANAEPLNYLIPRKGMKKHISKILNSFIFKILVFLCLAVNFGLLLIHGDNKSTEIFITFDFVSYCIWTFFFSEMIFKIFSNGFFTYIYQSKNLVEMLIVICNFIHIILINSSVVMSIQDSYIKLCVVKSLNLLKLTVVLRIIRNVKSVENLYNSLKYSFPLLFNLILIVLITLFIYSLIGCLFFNSVMKGKIVDDYINFKNIFNGMMTLFKCLTCDNWADIMIDFSKIPPNCIENVDCGSSKFFKNY